MTVGGDRAMFGDWHGERPLYEVKANMFKALAHPRRIRVLELLSEAADQPNGQPEVGVSTLLSETGLEPSRLSQHLAVLRRNHVVIAERRGSQVFYRLAFPQIVDLLAVSTELLTEILLANTVRLSLVSRRRYGPSRADGTASDPVRGGQPAPSGAGELEQDLSG